MLSYYEHARQISKMHSEIDRHDKHRSFLDSRKSSRKQGMRNKKRKGKRK